MKPLALIVLLLGFCLITEPVSAQRFRRARSRKAKSQRVCCCCCYPATLAATNHVPATPVATMALPSSPAAIANITAPAPIANAPGMSTAKSSPAPVTVLDGESIASPSDVAAEEDIAASSKKWKSLFDGKTLGDWIATRFGGEGEVVVENGQISCDFGQYISGITYKGKDLPKNNYEIELEAMRVDGSDFFCGLTFPVDESHATFVVGGWGGSVTGISSIDDYDASENDTTDYMQFKNKQWYKIRLRVTKGVIEAWINDKKVVSKDVEGSRLTTRIEVDPSKPLGIACFDTQAAYRNIRIRSETDPDSKTKN